MSEMFDNYPQSDSYIPNNRRRCFPKKDITIMSGETTIHTFEVPFNVLTDAIDFDILYKLGITVVLTKNWQDCEINYDEEKNRTFVTCVLSSEETKLFIETLEQCQVQIKFRMKDLSVSYSNIYNIKLINSLDNTPFSGEGEKPIPHLISGIGYTED